MINQFQEQEGKLQERSEGDGEENFCEEMEEMCWRPKSISPPTFRNKGQKQDIKYQQSKLNPIINKIIGVIPLRQKLIKQKLERQFLSSLNKVTSDSDKYLSEHQVRSLFKQLKMLTQSTPKQLTQSILNHLKNKSNQIETVRVKQFFFLMFNNPKDKDGILDSNSRQKFIELYHNRLSYSKQTQEVASKSPLRSISISNKTKTSLMSKRYRERLMSAHGVSTRKEGRENIENIEVAVVKKKRIKILISNW